MTTDRSVVAGDRSVPIKQVRSNVCSLVALWPNASQETIAQHDSKVLVDKWLLFVGQFPIRSFLFTIIIFTTTTKKSWDNFPSVVGRWQWLLFVRQFPINSCLLTVTIIIVRDNCPTLAARWVLTLIIIIVRDNCPAVLFDRRVLTITVIIVLTTVQL